MSEAEPLGLFLARVSNDQSRNPYRRWILPEAVADGAARHRCARPGGGRQVDQAAASEPPEPIEPRIRRRLRGTSGESRPNRIEPVSISVSLLLLRRPPYEGKAHTPIGKVPIDYSKTDQAIFRHELFGILRGQRNLALRLGEVRADRSQPWTLKPQAQKDLLNNRRTVADLTDDDFVSVLRQKGVDMRIGLDIASITLKRQAGIIVLVAGDADFVPAAKLARREGVQFILDPLWQSVSPDLSEHMDGLTSGFSKPR